jgi:hypothetical protein
MGLRVGLVIMSVAESHNTNSANITFKMGSIGVDVRTYRLAACESDAMAQAAVIDSLVKTVLNDWPRIAYRSQVQQLVREKCKAK